VPPGERIYAIGDIHGRLDLLYELLTKIRADLAMRTAMQTRYVILGDIIDRGPQSRDVLEVLAGLRLPNLVVLKGNHEAALIDARRGNHDAAKFWATFGGLATLASFGVDVALLDHADSHAIIDLVQAAISDELADWLDELPISFTSGDYFFVHAGIRPGVPIAKQSESDLLWIRDAFLNSRTDHGRMIVHGHSVNPGGIEFTPNRIGIDTGAYRTGRLSAIGLEGDEAWSLQTGESFETETGAGQNMA
jgi:serine/threonine protein phosphatase 1